MSRRDLIFLLNLIEFLFESDSSPGNNEKIKPGEFRNALAAYLDINITSSYENDKYVNNPVVPSKINANEEEKMKKQIKILEEQVASLNSMTEMTINYMQESISRLEQENKKIANSIRFVEKIIDNFINSPTKVPFRQSYAETNLNMEFIITSTTNKMGIFYALLIEKPFKDVSKSIFALFVNYLLEQIVTSKRINSASSLIVELENQIQAIQDRINTNKETSKINIAACIIEKQMGDLEYATNSFTLYLLNRGNLISFTHHQSKSEYNNDKYPTERALLREGAEVFLVADEQKDLQQDLLNKLRNETDLDTKVKDVIRFQEQQQKSAAVLAIKF